MELWSSSELFVVVVGISSFRSSRLAVCVTDVLKVLNISGGSLGLAAKDAKHRGHSP